MDSHGREVATSEPLRKIWVHSSSVCNLHTAWRLETSSRLWTVKAAMLSLQWGHVLELLLLVIVMIIVQRRALRIMVKDSRNFHIRAAMLIKEAFIYSLERRRLRRDLIGTYIKYSLEKNRITLVNFWTDRWHERTQKTLYKPPLVQTEMPYN